MNKGVLKGNFKSGTLIFAVRKKYLAPPHLWLEQKVLENHYKQTTIHMNDFSRPADTITRRNFMKKTTLTIGAISLLSQGIGLGSFQSSPPPKPQCGGKCSKFDELDPTVFADSKFGPNVEVIYYTFGHCNCAKNNGRDNFGPASWRRHPKPPNFETLVVNAAFRRNNPEHTADDHKLRSHDEHNRLF
jgi:hypothetical protein